MYPLEVKLAATPQRSWARGFDCLDRLPVPWDHGAVFCLTPDPVTLTDKVDALPVRAL